MLELSQIVALAIFVVMFIKKPTEYPSACWRDESGPVRIWGALDAPQLAGGLFTAIIVGKVHRFTLDFIGYSDIKKGDICSAKWD